MKHFRKVLSFYKTDIRCNEHAELVIDYQIPAKKPYRVYVAPWPVGVKWQGALNGLTYIDRLGLGYQQLASKPAVRAWLDQLPREVVYQLSLFSQGFNRYTLNALWLISSDRYAYQLFMSSPNLFGIVLFCADMNSWNIEQVPALIGKKRGEILQACGLRAERPVLKIIDKLQLDQFDRTVWNDFRHVLNLQGYKVMSHMEYIDRHMISLAEEHEKLVSLGLLAKRLFRPENWEITPRRLSDLSNGLWMLDEPSDLEKFFNRSKSHDLHAWALSLLERRAVKRERQRRKKMVEEAIEYPRPPIQGDEAIHPIVNSRELFDEGEQMNHCIVRYHDEIMSGDYYAYKMVEPERATLGVSIEGPGSYKIDQIALAGNDDPSAQTLFRADQWLSGKAVLEKVA